MTFDDLLSAAAKQFGELSRAEKRLLEGASAGRTVICSDKDMELALDAPETWPVEVHVRAELLSWLCSDREAQAGVTRKGIILAVAKIAGVLDLQNAEVPFPLMMIQCLVPDGILSMHANTIGCRWVGKGVTL